MQDAHGPRTLRDAALRFFRHASPRFLCAVVFSCLAARIALGDWSVWDGAVVAGILVYWPVQEWLIHLLILHSRPFSILGRTIDPAVPRKHRAHHRDPWNLEILFIPVQGFATAIALSLLLWIGLMPRLGLAFTGLSFSFALALRYEWIHFLIHSPYRPRSRHYERLWRNHRLHHTRNEHYWYGVTMLGGDRLFRTAPRPGEVEASATCMALERAGDGRAAGL